MNCVVTAATVAVLESVLGVDEFERPIIVRVVVLTASSIANEME
jgi:hypothetical protein